MVFFHRKIPTLKHVMDTEAMAVQSEKIKEIDSDNDGRLDEATKETMRMYWDTYHSMKYYPWEILETP